MTSKKIIFFPDKLHEGSQELISKLNKGFRCFKSSKIDEFDQVFKQTGHFAIVFSDAEYGLNFLISNANALSGFKFKTYVLLPNLKRMNEDPNPLMNTLKMNIYLRNEVLDINKSIQEYLMDDHTLDLAKDT